MLTALLIFVVLFTISGIIRVRLATRIFVVVFAIKLQLSLLSNLNDKKYYKY